ncbi:MAG: MBL fold metallo-hydrolase [Acidobacteria bacterium]|nr:MBL fold metallo-hydrolase [Acidobacteriota bacterium]
MMRMTVLASGSKGNSTVVSSSKTRILVDAGLSCRELMRRMVAAGEDPHSLDAIIITHEHADHVAGLPVMARKLNIPVYMTESTHRAWVRQVTPRKRLMSYAQWLEQRKAEMQQRDEELVQLQTRAATGELPDDHFFAASAEDTLPLEHISSAALEREAYQAGKLETAAADDLCEDADSAPVRRNINENPSFLPKLEHFKAGSHLCIGDIDVTPFTIPHDAADPCGFVFEAEGVRIGFATDLGYVPPNVKLALKRCDALLLESNHDLEMLRDGPYPWSVKQRVLSRVGHLSNTATAEFLTKDYDGGAAVVVLAHLSENNNHPEMALQAAREALGGHPSLLGNRLLLARQDAPLESVRF